MGMRYYKKSLANLLFENASDRQRFRDALNESIDELAQKIASDLKVTALPGAEPSVPSNQNTAEKYAADALRARLPGAKVTRVNSISDIHITPDGKNEPVVKVEVKFSKKSIAGIRSGSTLLSAHDYIVFVDKNGYRWATSEQLIDFAKSRKGVAGMRDFSADDILKGTTEDIYDVIGVYDMTKGEYEYITKLIRSRIAKARGDTDKADVSYTMPFTIDGSKVRVDLKFESLFRKYISELLKE